MARPSGMPTICAIELPVATSPMAADDARGSTTRAATTITTAQNTLCAAATTRRAATSSQNVGATAHRNCPVANSASSPSMSRLNPTREASTMSGSDMSMTPHAYTDIMTAAPSSASEKDAPMSVRSPIGTNSDVLNTNAATASPASASHCLGRMSPSFSPAARPALPRAPPLPDAAIALPSPSVTERPV